jgi:hypothetical protein
MASPDVTAALNAHPTPPRFQLFADVQDFMAATLGGEAFDYGRDSESARAAACELGIEEDFDRLAAMSRELAPEVSASVRRAERRVLSLAQHARPAPTSPALAPLPGYAVASIWEGHTSPPYLVKRLLAPGELTVLFGESGHFKSVAAIDLALSVGSGAAFHGLRSRRGGVLYVAGEGHVGIRKRVRAWLLARGYDASSEQPALYFTSAGADLIGNPQQLVATVDRAAQEIGAAIELVVIDTLAANFGPGDENHATDMQLAIHGARHAAPGAAVLLVHHVGHGQVQRERGSYALVAAADCRVQATYDENLKSIELCWHKLKDDERPQPMVFGWRAVPLDWQDEDGEELSSVVLELLDGPRPHAAPRLDKLGKRQEAALKVLRALFARTRKNLADRGDDPAKACILISGWKNATVSETFPNNRFNEALVQLEARGLIARDGPHVRLIEEAE